MTKFFIRHTKLKRDDVKCYEHRAAINWAVCCKTSWFTTTTTKSHHQTLYGVGWLHHNTLYP